MLNLGTTLTSNMRNTRAGTVAATVLIVLVVVGPAPASAGTLLDRALEIAAAKAFPAGQGTAATSTECLLAANAGTTEGASEAAFRYFGNGLIMPFYAVSKARQSPAEPPAEVLQRYPGQLGECFADGYRDARRRARAQTAFYGSLTTATIVAVWVLVPALAGGDDFSDYYRQDPEGAAGVCGTCAQIRVDEATCPSAPPSACRNRELCTHQRRRRPGASGTGSSNDSSVMADISTTGVLGRADHVTARMINETVK